MIPIDYKNNNGLLEKQTYGNNDYVNYSYDSLDREITRKYNGTAKFKWFYNALGQVGVYKDLVLDKNYYYSYDDIGRLVRTDVSDGTWFKTNYNTLDQTTGVHYKFNGQPRDVYFGYSDRDNLPAYVKFGTGSAYQVTNNYDKLTRLGSKTYKVTGNDGANVETSFGYLDLEDSDRTTGVVESIRYTYSADGMSIPNLCYDYDNVGNITAERTWVQGNTDKPLREKYTYDDKNQLIRHDSYTNNATYVYTYDAAGNITCREKYAYTLDAIDTDANKIEYTYGYEDESWGDLLTSYNGQSISYDDIGNPTSYLGWTLGWQGRQLLTATNGGNSLSFTYNSDGIRTSKTFNGVTTEYLLNGTQILAQKTGDTTLWFFYDSEGNRVGMSNGNVFYYYICNLQSDVIGIADAETGEIVATYNYDAWGNCTIGDGSADIATLNPFRYRGYYYDTETELYYLNSRYYDAETGRFINADAFASTDINGPLSANMFAYCENNPVMRCDPTGEIFWDILAGAIGGAAASAALYMAATGNMDTKGVLTAMATGAVVGALSAVEGPAKAVTSILSGVVSGVSTAINTKGTVGEKVVAGVVNGTITAATSYVGSGIKFDSGTTVAGKALDTYANAHISFGNGFKVGGVAQATQKIAIQASKAVSSAYKSIQKAFSRFIGRW